MDAGSQTLLERLLTKQKQNPRSFQQPMAGGMRATVTPIDSLSSQSMMDEAQETSVTPASSSPFRFASSSQGEEGGSPFQTAQLRRSGGAQTQATTAGNCKNGNCGLPSGMANQGQYPIISERVISINGVPVNQGSPSPAAPSVSQPQQSQPVDLSPQALYQRSLNTINAANANWPANPAASANLSVIGRNEHKAALEQAARQEELAILKEQQRDAHHNAIEERKNQRLKRDIAFRDTEAGVSDTLTNAIHGTGEFTKEDGSPQDPFARAHAAASRIYGINSAGKDKEPVEYKSLFDEIHGKATAHDLGDSIASQVTVGQDGKPFFRVGNRPYLDQLVLNRFFGRKLSDVTKDEKHENTFLTGEELRSSMHKELDEPLQEQLTQRYVEISPGMSPKEARLLAKSQAYDIVEKYHDHVDARNKVLASTGGDIQKTADIFVRLGKMIGLGGSEKPRQSQPAQQQSQPQQAQQPQQQQQQQKALTPDSERSGMPMYFFPH